MRDVTLRQWVVEGARRGTRQRIVDLAFWWRAMVYTMAGHVGGLVKVCPPRPKAVRVSDQLSIAAWLGEESPSDEEPQSGFTGYIARYVNICREDVNAAESYLSNLITPKPPLEVALVDDEQGVRMDRTEVLNKCAAEFAAWADEGGQGDPAFNAYVRRETKRARAAAQAETLCEDVDPFSKGKVDQILKQTNASRRSLRLPRIASRADADAGRSATWALCCLAAVLGLVPSFWLREVAPIRKRGAGVVTAMGVLRPISYVDAIEGVLDGLWLDAVRTPLEEYSTESQSGGKVEHTLVVIGC
jgi:hypothetical protein